jgi:hypothetical protein
MHFYVGTEGVKTKHIPLELANPPNIESFVMLEEENH